MIQSIQQIYTKIDFKMILNGYHIYRLFYIQLNRTINKKIYFVKANKHSANLY